MKAVVKFSVVRAIATVGDVTMEEGGSGFVVFSLEGEVLRTVSLRRPIMA